MIDLVLSHTSNQHAWFQESRDQPRQSQGRLVRLGRCQARWQPAQQLAVDLRRVGLGMGRATGCSITCTTSSTSQPDLNLHNPEVQEALLDVVRFWLDRGVDGFRLDTINFYFHDKELRDNPALAKELRNATIAPEVNPYNHQDHLYDKNQPENLEFLRRFRALLDEYPGTTAVGEVGDAQYGLQIQAEYTSGGDKVHMCYSFEFLSPRPLSAAACRTDHVAARFGLSLPGRGTRSDRGRARL
jgi:alpha-glucosidase